MGRSHFCSKVSMYSTRRREDIESGTGVEVKGLISKFVLGCGRTGTDRQFFFVNGRPCALPKVRCSCFK
jgi:DNA mismatch repair protein PMS2